MFSLNTFGEQRKTNQDTLVNCWQCWLFYVVTLLILKIFCKTYFRSSAFDKLESSKFWETFDDPDVTSVTQNKKWNQLSYESSFSCKLNSLLHKRFCIKKRLKEDGKWFIIPLYLAIWAGSGQVRNDILKLINYSPS